ncbi:MAG: hypothetical protein AABX80_02555 [Nanoarchaeota archaeon]
MKQDNNLFTLGIFTILLISGTYGIFEFNKEQNKSKLEKLADENKNEKLDSNEKTKMYQMCGLKDTTEYTSSSDLEKGIQNYQREIDSLNNVYR